MTFSDPLKDYEKYHRIPLDCHLQGIEIQKAIINPGQESIISFVVIEDQKMVLKAVFDEVRAGQRYQAIDGEIEARIAQLLTTRFLLTKKTPHLVCTYQIKSCHDPEIFLKNVFEKTKKSHLSKKTLEDYLLSPIGDERDALHTRFQIQFGLYHEDYYLILMERCETDLSEFLADLSEDITKEPPSPQSLKLFENYLEALERIFFQLIFTLAVIEKKYPRFRHGDLYGKNIFLNFYPSDTQSVDEYAYENLRFYLPRGGEMVKIGDFGMTILDAENTISQTETIDNVLGDRRQAYDLYNFFVLVYQHFSFYLTEHLGYFLVARKFMGRFIDVDALDAQLSTDIPVFQNFSKNQNAKTANEYLLGKTFEKFQKRPSDVTIKNRYNIE